MDIADAFAQMAEKHRYREARLSSLLLRCRSSCQLSLLNIRPHAQVLFMADTCQASTLAKHFYAPGVVAIGSRALGEPSWSYSPDAEVGLSGAFRAMAGAWQAG